VNGLYQSIFFCASTFKRRADLSVKDLHIHRHHPPQLDPKTLKPLLSPARTAVNAVVLVAMHRHAHAHAAGQCVQFFKAVFVVAGGFVGDQDVGLHRGQLRHFVGIDGGPVFQVHAALPAVLARGLAGVFFTVAKLGGLAVFGVPNGTTKNAAQPGYARAARQGDDAAMQAALGQFAVPHMGKIVGVVGVVVAVDVPDTLPNGFQLDVQRACGLQVTQQDDGAGLGLQRGIDDVLPLAVRIAAKEDGAGHV